MFALSLHAVTLQRRTYEVNSRFLCFLPWNTCCFSFVFNVIIISFYFLLYRFDCTQDEAFCAETFYAVEKNRCEEENNLSTCFEVALSTTRNTFAQCQDHIKEGKMKEEWFCLRPRDLRNSPFVICTFIDWRQNVVNLATPPMKPHLKIFFLYAKFPFTNFFVCLGWKKNLIHKNTLFRWRRWIWETRAIQSNTLWHLINRSERHYRTEIKYKWRCSLA